MNERSAQTPPLPCGEGAGGEGRSTAAQPNQRARKLGHGYAPSFGEDRQKDHARTKLRAARMRRDMTSAEAAFWKLLRTIEGETFRRQVAIGDYVFDFGHYKRRLLIEIDGAVHEFEDVKARDKSKVLFAVLQGFRVLRFKNEDVLDRPAWVIEQVRERLFAPHPPTPSPQGRGGESQQ